MAKRGLFIAASASHLECVSDALIPHAVTIPIGFAVSCFDTQNAGRRSRAGVVVGLVPNPPYPRDDMIRPLTPAMSRSFLHRRAGPHPTSSFTTSSVPSYSPPVRGRMMPIASVPITDTATAVRTGSERMQAMAPAGCSA